MLPRGSRVVAAVSGGPDSVCLLLVLLELAPGLGVTVEGVAHVNHQLRGDESEGDERFVAELASAAGLTFHNTVAPADVEAGNLEQSLRSARREFFSSLMQEGHATHVALGHTLDDQAETVLFRMLRGSGLAGLAGVLPVAGNGFVRPLLAVTRAETEAHVRGLDIRYREDSSNRDWRFARNRIRHHLLPQLAREWNPRVRESLAHLGALAYEEERWWAAEMVRLAAGLFVKRDDGIEMEASQLTALPTAVARRLVRFAIHTVKGDLRGIEFDHVERVLALASASAGDGRVDLPWLRVQRSFDWLRVSLAGREPFHYPAQWVKIPGRYDAPDAHSLILLNPAPRRSYATLKMDLSWRKLPPGIQLRGWQPGDAYRPLGQSRERKVKEMFQDARVPSWRRAGWPILCSGGKILWAQEFGVAQEFAGEPRGRVVRVRQVPRRYE